MALDSGHAGMAGFPVIATARATRLVVGADFEMTRKDVPSFSERHARRMIAALASMALLTLLATSGESPSRPLLHAVVFGLACSYFFRWRAMHDERRRNETMEDERDRKIQSTGAEVARAILSVCVGAAAVALTIGPLRQWLMAEPLLAPALLVLALIMANLAGHIVVVRAYRMDRT